MFIDVKGGDILSYKTDFEHIFLKQTTEYYIKYSEHMLHNLTCTQYLSKTESIIREEQQRENDFLHESTHAELLKILYSILLVTHQSTIIHMSTGVYSMMTNKDYKSLSLLYKLYSCAPNTLPNICKIVSKRIEDECVEKLKNAFLKKNTKIFVETLLKLYINHENIIDNCFKNNSDFSKSLKDGYSTILNNTSVMHAIDSSANTKSISELLCIYIDFLMRNEIDAHELRLQTLIKLFAYLYDKDLFLEIYRKQLAKRLLTGRSYSELMEISFISQMKLICGIQLTSKLEGIIKDMNRSFDHGIKFGKYLKQKKKEYEFEFGCKILTNGFWPSFNGKNGELLLPISMKSKLNDFKRYFLGLHQKRVLRWMHELGVVHILCHFEHKSVVVEVSTLQACVLLILNQIESIRIMDIVRMVNCELDDMKVQLRPLCSTKFHILNKEPKKGYNVKDSLSMNMRWNPCKKRYRIPMGVHHKISKGEMKQCLDTVINDRKFIIEANIVRIMKARKCMKHSNLIAEVISHVVHKFQPNPKQIKIRILDLIEREYIRRDEKDSHKYFYVA